jgi:5'-nucleotidase / UDP-sugar diphosphatase
MSAVCFALSLCPWKLVGWSDVKLLAVAFSLPLVVLSSAMIRRVLPASLLFILLVLGLAQSQSSSTLILLHTNDMHGQVLPRDGVGGLAQLATVIRRENPDLILDGGDFFTGTMASDEFFGKPVIEVMNRLRYSAVALGNHEFDYGLPELRSRLKEARFPMLSANVTGIEEVRPYTILNVKGVRIGVIGLTVENLENLTHRKNLKTITITPVVDALRETLPKVRPLSDFIVAVAHLSFDEQIRVAKAFPEIRLIVAGHPHVARATQVGQTLIVETGSRIENVGKVEIRLSGKTPELMSSQIIPISGVPPDREVQSVIAPYEKTILARASQKLGEARVEIRKSDVEESPLNNLVADALREAGKTQIGLHNIGGIRATLRRGTITRGDVFEVMPFYDTVITMSLTGQQVRQTLGRRILAVSGLRVTWDLSRAWPNQVVSVSLANGQPLQDSARYTVAVNDYMAAGGDGLEELTQGTSIDDTGILIRDAIASYLKTRPVVSAATDGRVTIRGR